MKGQRQPQLPKCLLQPSIIPAAAPQPVEALVPADSLRASLVYELQGSGQTDNGFLDLSGCQKNPHGNQAKLLV